MDLKQLYYFVTAVNSGNISAAARKLYMSQPPLSKQLHSLETELGCTLFERGSRNITLTKAGQTLYTHAVSILDMAEIARQETLISAKKQNETIRIGIISSVMYSFASKWIKNFSILYPDVNFDIVEDNTYNLLQKFHGNSIHLAILRTPFNDTDLKTAKIFTDCIIAIGDKALFENCQNCTSLEYLSHKKLITYRRWLPFIKKEFDKKNLLPDFHFINDDARTSIHLSEYGLGIALVPESASLGLIHPDIISIPIKDCTISSDVVIAYKPEHTLPKSTLQFIDFITDGLLIKRPFI